LTTTTFHPSAQSEMKAAAIWYEGQQANLGKRFLAAVEDAIKRVEINPNLFPVVEHDVRGCLTRTFPYRVLFRIEPSTVVVMAVMHLHRDPGYWRARKASA
jgi:toxin ParE1/3/4